MARSRVRLSADTIEVRGLVHSKSLTRGEICGWRWFPMEYGRPTRRLYSHFDTTPKLTLPQGLATDATFDAWLAEFPDLDAQAMRAAEQE